MDESQGKSYQKRKGFDKRKLIYDLAHLVAHLVNQGLTRAGPHQRGPDVLSNDRASLSTKASP